MSKGLRFAGCLPGRMLARLPHDRRQGPERGGCTERGPCPLGSRNTETAHKQLQGSVWLPVCPPSPVSPPVRVHPPTRPVFTEHLLGGPAPGAGTALDQAATWPALVGLPSSWTHGQRCIKTGRPRDTGSQSKRDSHRSKHGKTERV